MSGQSLHLLQAGPCGRRHWGLRAGLANDISRTAMWLKAEAAYMWSKTCLCASLLQRITDLDRRGPVPFRTSSSQQSGSKCKTMEKAAVNEANTKQSSRGFCNRFQA